MRILILALTCCLLAGPAAAQAPAPQPEIAVEPQSLGRTTGDHEVEEVRLVAVPVAFSRVRGDTPDLANIMRAALGDLLARLGAAGVTPVSAPLAVYLELGDTDFTAELMVPVPADTAAPPGLRLGTSPEGRALRVRHTGPLDTLDETYEALAGFVEDSGAEVRDVIIERYLSDPSTTPATDLVTELYVMLR